MSIKITQEIIELVTEYLQEGEAPQEYIDACLYGYRNTSLHARKYSEYNAMYFPDSPKGSYAVKTILHERGVSNCTKCEKILPIEEFSTNGKGGIASICKNCDSGKDNRKSQSAKIEGFSSNIKGIDRKSLLDILQELKNFIGRNPTFYEIKNTKEMPDIELYKKHFKQFSRAIEIIDKTCKECGGKNYRYISPFCSEFHSLLYNMKNKTKGDTQTKGLGGNNYRGIRDNASKIVSYYNIDKICYNCGYAIYTEIAHIKAVSDFDDTATLYEINAITNLVPLCPNCHKTYDKNLITIDFTNHIQKYEQLWEEKKTE